MAELDVEDRLEAAEQTVLREKMALERAQTRQDVLEKYTRDKTIKELRVEVEKASARTSWPSSDLGSWRRARTRSSSKQIENCKLFAPSDGIVVYANDPNRRTGQCQPQIEEGATVRERQKIFSLPDLDAPMRVNTKVHESDGRPAHPGAAGPDQGRRLPRGES